MARLSSVLVVDSDPKGLDTLAYGFDREGCRVASTADVDRVAELAKQEAPQAVVVCLRAGAATRDRLQDLAVALSGGASPVPIVAIVAADVRDSVTGIVGVDLLPLPSFVRDVVTATRLRVALGAATGSEQEAQGSLSEYGLYFLTRALMALGVSASVVVERANRKGELRLFEGAVTSIQVGTIQGLPALYHLLLWEEAALEVKLRPTARRPAVARAEDVIEESERFLRDFAHAVKPLGTAHTVFETVASEQGESPAEAAPVMRLLDGKRTLAEIIEESPFRIFDTLRLLSRMLDLGSVRAREPARSEGSNGATGSHKPILDHWLRGIEDEPRAESPAENHREVVAAEPRGVVAAEPTRRRARTATPAPPASIGPPKREARGEIRASVRTSTSDRPKRPSVLVDLPVEPSTEHAAVAPAPEAPPPIVARAVEPTQPAPVAQVAAYPAPAAVVPPTIVPPMIVPPSVVPPSVVPPSAAAQTIAAPSIAAPVRSLTPPPAVAPVRAATPAAGVPTPGVPVPIAAAGSGAVAAPAPRANSGSIEIDPALLAEMDAYEMANTPPTPPPELNVMASAPPAIVAPPAPPAEPVAAAAAANVIPPLAEPASRTPTPRHTPAPDVVSFVRKPTPAPVPAAGTHAQTPPRAVTPVPLATKSPTGRVNAAPPRRPSGEFDALESDFFARESEIFERPDFENFDDADGKRR